MYRISTAGDRHANAWTRLIAPPIFAALFIVLASSAYGAANILWSGDFETGDFTQWHQVGRDEPNYSQMPRYCAPPPVGIGWCLELVDAPVRQGDHAAKFTVMNSSLGDEPRDCDQNGSNCIRRRSMLTAQGLLPDEYNALPYMSERWLSLSVYVPEDWDFSGSGWGPVFYGVKPRNEHGLSGLIQFELQEHTWRVYHRWSDVENPASDDITWQQSMFYDAEYPAPDGSDTGWDLRADFPDQTLSQQALGDVNAGGWTDWVVHIKFDARGSADGGTGSMNVWKRAGDGQWIHVLDIRPRVVTRGVSDNEVTFDRGIGYNSPPGENDNGGFGPKVGLYMNKDQVWDLTNPRVVVLDNIKVGDENATFADMSPDGSTPND